MRLPFLPLSEWKEALGNFARQFGTEETEIERGISRLIGELARRTGEGRDVSVTEADLVDAFTEFNQTRRLTFDSIRELSLPELRRFVDRHELPSAPVRRKLLDEIDRETRGRALVILSGVGGCGKTIALAQWALEKASAPAPYGKPSAVISAASAIPRLCITEAICDWAKLPSVGHSRRTEELEQALHRLSTANPGASRPVFYLGLDGLDENVASADQVHVVRNILNWFWKQDQSASQDIRRVPEATLVVTCRKAEEVVERWLDLDASGYGYRGKTPANIAVADFSPDELLQAAQIGTPTLSGRIEVALRAAYGSPYMPMTEPELITFEDIHTPKVDDRILQALVHPAMWRAFLELSYPSQVDTLDGQAEAIKMLAARFLRRFCTKMLRRGRIGGLDEGKLLDVLVTIASQCRSSSASRHTVASWIDTVSKSNWIRGEGEARILYFEALSGGIILEDDRNHWRWRHDFVEAHLAELNLA